MSSSSPNLEPNLDLMKEGTVGHLVRWAFFMFIFFFVVILFDITVNPSIDSML